MTMLRKSIVLGLLAGAMLPAPGADVLAQRAVSAPASRRRAILPPPAMEPAQARAQAGLPPGWIEQLQEMTPAEQQRFLRNNARFRGLPAQQQALIRRRLRAWNNLPSSERQQMLERQQIWQQLPQEQRRQVRESLLPRWQSLPVRRRELILLKLRELRGLDASERAAKLDDENFLGNMTVEERQMLRDLSSLGGGQAAG